MRVPTPRAMVRLLLNFAVQKPKDMVPLVPPTIGFGRGACRRDLHVLKFEFLQNFATACCLIASWWMKPIIWGRGVVLLRADSPTPSMLEPSASRIQANTMNSQNVKSWWSYSMVVKLWARKRMHWISFELCKRCRLRSFCRKWRFQLQALETLAADFIMSFAWCCKFCFHLFLWGSCNDVMDRGPSEGHRERGFES